MSEQLPHKRGWRYYKTSSGACPVKDFLDMLTEADAAAVVAAMKDVAIEGDQIAHFLRNGIYEVRARGKDRIYRILYAHEGKHDQILLALEGFPKKTNKVPDHEIKLAEKRLADWRSRG